jgi:hypothetical protein
MGAVAAAAVADEARPDRVWAQTGEQVRHAGRLVRLVNDIATYRREVEEGKVSAVTIALPAHAYATRAALAHVRARLDAEARAFPLWGMLDHGPLAAYLARITAVAIATYLREAGQLAA